MRRRVLIYAVLAAIAAAPFAVAGRPAAAQEFKSVKVLAGETLFQQECRRCHAPDTEHDS